MRLLVFLADGFEEVEALTIVDYLRRMDITVDMVSISDNNLVSGAHNIQVMADKVISEIDYSHYDGVFIPGGMPGAANLRDNTQVIEIVKSMFKDNKLIAAICAGPIVLARANIIKNRNITSFPGFESELSDSNYQAESLVVDDNIISARGPFFAVDLALAIVDHLLGIDKVRELKSDILYEK